MERSRSLERELFSCERVSERVRMLHVQQFLSVLET